MRAMTCLLSGILLLSGCESTSKTRAPAADFGLGGLRLEVPCADHFNHDTECHWDRSLLQSQDPAWKLKREIVRTFAGRPGTLYSVTLHVRGVVEPKNFTGGAVQFDHFQTGGDPVKNDYNFYRLSVAEPNAVYTFNRNEEKVGHYTFPIDYSVTIPIRGGTTVTMGAYDSNDVAIANHQGNVVPGVPPFPAAFDGQFFDIAVVKVAAAR